jgi:hypothetical protein
LTLPFGGLYFAQQPRQIKGYRLFGGERPLFERGESMHNRFSWSLVAFAMAVILTGCAPREQAPEPPVEAERGAPVVGDRAAATEEIAATVQAMPMGDHMHFILRVTNTTGSPIELTFPTGQSYDFVVMQDNREIWRWSDDQMFTQAIRNEQLRPGETRNFDAMWTPEQGLSGTFMLVGILTATNYRIEQATEFQLP